jgi:hypothetical protein
MPVRWSWRWCVALAFVFVLTTGYFTLVLRNNCFFASGPDSSGYLSEAKLLAAGRLTVAVAPIIASRTDPALKEVFIPLGFASGPGMTMTPTYPPGLPLLMALFAKIGGWQRAPFLVAPVAALGCLLLMYALARAVGLPRGWSLLAPALLAPTSPFLAFAMQPMSDVVATCCVLAAIVAAFCARRVRVWGFVAGFAFALAVAVRPTNALAALPLFFALPLRPRAWLACIAGALPLALALLFYNHVQYGSPFRFGFASIADVLSPRPVCGGFHLWWTMRTLTPIAAALGWIVLFLRDVPLRTRLLLGSWFAAFFVFYAFYDYCPNWNAVRFLLPAFPAVIVATLLVARRIAAALADRGWRRFGVSVAVIAVLLMLYGEMDLTSEFRVFRVDDHESVFPETVRWTESVVPRNALLVAGVHSGAFFCYGHWTARWDRLDAARLARLRADARRPLFAVISDGEVDSAELMRRVPAHWIKVGRRRDVTLYRLD